MSDESINNYPKQLAGVSTPLPFGDAASSTRTDVKMALTALKQRYPMTSELRANMLLWLSDVASSAEDSRARVNAVKGLIEIDKLNMEEEKRAAGGDKLAIDITSGGKPLGAGDVRQLTDDELRQRIVELETRAITSGQ